MGIQIFFPPATNTLIADNDGYSTISPNMVFLAQELQ